MVVYINMPRNSFKNRVDATLVVYNLFSVSLLNRFFALSLQSEKLKNGIMEMNKITREEVLRRYQSTRERKEKRLEEMKEILYKRYVNRTGEEPKYFFAL